MRSDPSSRPARGSLTAPRRPALASLAPAALAKALAGVLAGVLAGGLTGCDSPACVFGAGGCSENPDEPLGVGPALVPQDGQWIADGRPRVEAVFPTGDEVHPQSPIVLRFSESMNPATVSSGAFILVNASQVGAVPPIAAPFLLGDGRFLVLVPAAELPAGAEIQVRYQEGVDATDLTGQLLDAEPDSVIGGFTVSTSPSDEPSVIATWPPAGADDASATTEIITVFDQRMKTTNISSGGWLVTVGSPPPLPTAPTALPQILGSRVWSLAEPATPYTTGAGVTLALSPTGAELESEAGEPLDGVSFTFDIAPFGPPIATTIASAPNDAIGIENLKATSDRSLELALTLDTAQVGDEIGVFAFGSSLEDPLVLASFQGGLSLTEVPDANPDGTIPISVGLASIPVVQAESNDALFGDGEVFLGIRIARGGSISPMRMLDIDPQLPGTQPPTLDTVRPTFSALTNPGFVPTDFKSSQVDLVLTGKANEQLRAVNVTITDPLITDPVTSNQILMDADFAPVVGSTITGDFIAAPVPIGVVEPVDVGPMGTPELTIPELAYQFELYDRALNAAEQSPGDEVFEGVFRQYGGVGDDLEDGVDTEIFLEVIDANSLEPIVGALVVSQGYDSGTQLAAGARNEATTDADGRVTVPVQTPTTLDTVIAIDAAGYDLFTFHGVRTRWASLLLDRSDVADATVEGTITAVAQETKDALIDDNPSVLLADSRRPDGLPPTYEAKPCVPSLIATNCTFGPEVLRPDRIGAQTLLVGDFDGPPPITDLSSFFIGFEPRVPVPPVDPDGTSLSIVNYDEKLTGGLADTTDNLSFDTDLMTFFDQALELYDLEPFDDDAFFGPLRASVEVRLPGVDRPVPIGLGVSNQVAGDIIGVTGDPLSFVSPVVEVQAAFPRRPFDYLPDPGVVDCSTTSLGAAGKCLEDIAHFVIVIRDRLGNVSVARPRLSQQVEFLVNDDSYGPPLVPTVLVVNEASGQIDVDPGLVIRFNDALPPIYKTFFSADGMFEVTVTNPATGRAHTAVRYDDTDDSGDNPANLEVLFIDTADTTLVSPGAGLGLGEVTYQTRYYAWFGAEVAGAPVDAFDRNRFLWSELPLQANLYAETAPKTVELIDGTP